MQENVAVAINAASEPIEYNPAVPIETFDIIVTDECHRSIYNLWAQVLEYFDATLLTALADAMQQLYLSFQSWHEWSDAKWKSRRAKKVRAAK